MPSLEWGIESVKLLDFNLLEGGEAFSTEVCRWSGRRPASKILPDEDSSDGILTGGIDELWLLLWDLGSILLTRKKWPKLPVGTLHEDENLVLKGTSVWTLWSSGSKTGVFEVLSSTMKSCVTIDTCTTHYQKLDWRKLKLSSGYGLISCQTNGRKYPRQRQTLQEEGI